MDKNSKSKNLSWAEEEIKIACKRERASSEMAKGWDYGCACYLSAYRAYRILCKDRHSGLSMSFTQAILNRLIENKPLSPIVDTPDIWIDVSEYDSDKEYRSYQCKRMSSLFKYVYPDGTVRYKDVGRIVCMDVTSGSQYSNGLIDRIIDEIDPITMPYMPSDGLIKVYCTDFLTDLKNGDFDTKGIFFAVKPDGTEININRFFKEGSDDWVEIGIEEYVQRKDMEVKRIYH